MYVAILVAVSLAFIGTYFAALAQIFYMTECTGNFTTPAIGASTAAVNFLVAILCLFVAIFTMITCVKDRSRKCSDSCIRAFIFLILLLVSNIFAL